MLDRLNAFLADVCALNVAAPDLNHVNVARDHTLGRERFVLIDGFGDKAMVPLRTLFPTLNARRRDRQFEKLARFAPLRWPPGVRRFSLRGSQ